MKKRIQYMMAMVWCVENPYAVCKETIGNFMAKRQGTIDQFLKRYFLQNSLLLTVYFLLCISLTHAQRYPVQVTQTIIPPYTTKLSDYTSASDVKLRLHLLLTDVVANNKQVRLKLRIQGNGLDIRSVDFVHGASPIFLNGGVSNQYTNIDLSSYFEPNNLIGITPRQYQKSLPEGVYTFCWEVYDAFTNEQLNHPTLGCSNIYLLLNDPPFLNVPYKGDQVVAQDPMNIIFQWTPRHANASNVSYEFELRELWDTQIAPEAAFLTSPNYYTETTATTTLLYHIGKPTLLPNKRYGWRVRAVSRTGLSKHSVFKNDGYSEIYYFTYNTACYPPRYVLSEAVGKARVQIRWQGMPEHKRYHVQYKRADIPDAEWFEVYTYNTQVQISNLRAGKTYVFRVGGSCNELNDFNPLYAYSAINEFSLPAKNEKSRSYTCGIVPEIEISNTQPLQNIGINETFTAGDFPVTIKQVSGSNGRFRGVGYIVVPYLADTKLAVSFTNIRINTDYQLIEGVVSTTYDTTWGDVESVDEFIDGLGDLIDEIEETVNTLFENGEITSEEKEDALGQLNEATTNLQGAAEQQNQADEKKQQAEKAESPEKEKLQEEAEKLEKESKETQQEVNKALNELQNKFGVKGKDGGLEIKTDAFFDGVISYGKGKNVITHKRLDGNGEISINTTDPNNNIPDTSDYNFTHNGKQYNVIVTHSNSTIEAINDAKDKAVNPSTGIVIYFHYDLEKENLGYTVNFAPDYFDNLPNQDFLEVQELHKEALLNLLKQLQSSEDIINVIYNNVLEINTLFQESLNKIQLPETIWNPDAENYTNNDFHFEPLEAGLIDGAIEEIKSIPLLISLVVDYSTNPKTREKINKAFSDFDFTNAMNKWYESRKDLYTSGTIHKIEHRTGKDVVEVGTLIGTGGLATLGKIKKGADLVEGLTSAIKKVAKAGDDIGTLLAKYKNVRKYLDDGQIKAYLNATDADKFTDVLRKGHPDVLKHMDEMNVDDFGEMVRGFIDNPKKFKESIISATEFIGTSSRPGFLKFWKLTPKMKDGLRTVRELRSKGKLLPTGDATSIQLASIQNYTAWGNFVNVPMRFGAHFGEYASKARIHIEKGLNLLRKVPSRNKAGEVVFSGRAYSLDDFNRLFVGKKGMEVVINKGFVSSSLDEKVATHFANITSSKTNTIKVIRRIETKTGVYLDDLADYGKNLGPIRHGDQPPVAQIQKEVLMKEGLFKQLSEPKLLKEVDGVKWYYIDFVELAKPLK